MAGDAVFGWIAVVVAVFAFGSFAVPIKFPSVRNAEPPIHPFVFQTYKSAWVFITSWFILIIRPLSFTWLGCVSAMFWVPAGAAYVVAVDHIGIGITQAVVSSGVITVSTLWGLLYFGEPIKSPLLAALAFSLLAGGVSTMAYFSAPSSPLLSQTYQKHRPSSSFQEGGVPAAGSSDESRYHSGRSPLLQEHARSEADVVEAIAPENNALGNNARHGDCEALVKGELVEYRLAAPVADEEHGGAPKWCPATVVDVSYDADLAPYYTVRLHDIGGEFGKEKGTVRERLRKRLETPALRAGVGSEEEEDELPLQQQQQQQQELGGGLEARNVAAGAPRKRSQVVGLLAALFNGVWGGSVMVPLKIAADSGASTGGVDFVVSFGVGVALVTCAGWLVLLLRALASTAGGVRGGSSTPGLPEALIPSLRIDVLLVPGSIAGFLWACGNFASMYAVLALGEAVGYSSCQAAVMVSGLWGVLYFGEAPRGGLQWFCGAVACTGGIVLLALVKG